MKNKKWNLIIILMLGISIVLNGYLFIESQNKTTTIVQLNKKNKELNKYSQLFKNGTDIKFVDIKESDGQISMAYLYQDKELIEKVINALDNIKIEEKTDISFSDNGKTYILEFADGTTQEYNFQGSYYCKDKINYKISNYKELNKIEIPKEN